MPAAPTAASVRGAAAFVALWEQIPGWRLLARIVRATPGVLPARGTALRLDRATTFPRRGGALPFRRLRMKRREKSDLPTKTCATCARPFAWRKKWARDWENVLYCSDRCRMQKTPSRSAPSDSPPRAR